MSKKAVVPDEVNARRLQPIYEALDARNYKQCAKLIAAAVEKVGPAQILLVRSSRRRPALGLLFTEMFSLAPIACRRSSPAL